jgi:putative transposase
MAQPLLISQSMSRPLRHIPTNAVVEITTRAIHGRFLLRPSPKLTAVLLGIIGRALARYGILLHAFFFASNHYHLIITVPDVRSLALFMCYLNSNTAREVGRMYDWKEKVWGRRYRHIEILDEDAQIERLDYVLEQGCKEGLIADPREWPGATCVHALLDDIPLQGLWYDRTAEWYARRRGEDFAEDEYAEKVEFELTPLPCWSGVDPAERRRRILVMVESIVQRTSESNLARGRQPLGVARLQARHPHDHPKSTKKSPAPRCHTTERERWIRFVQEARAFRDMYSAAAERWLDGVRDVAFPPDCFPPPLTFMRVSETALVPS